MSEVIRYEEHGEIAVVTMDDGKVNALSPGLIADLNGALDRAESDAKALVLCGRDGKFSAGFDLTVMLSSPQSAIDLLTAGADVMMRVYELPMPVVMACTGHAIAGGALLLATGDTRIGARGAFKIGLNEVANSMPVPILAHRLAKDRLDPRALVASVLHARMHSPDEALEAGWLDRVEVPDEVLDAALAEAQRLAELPRHAYAKTKASLRRQSIDHIRNTLQDDIAAMMGG